MKTALRDSQTDITAGRLEKPACDVVAVFHKAGELSAKYAASTLARSLEILHVAAALTLGARVFVSFDDRQRKIARRARLKVLRVSMAVSFAHRAESNRPAARSRRRKSPGFITGIP